jgi:hypothetical protein
LTYNQGWTLDKRQRKELRKVSKGIFNLKKFRGELKVYEYYPVITTKSFSKIAKNFNCTYKKNILLSINFSLHLVREAKSTGEVRI